MRPSRLLAMLSLALTLAISLAVSQSVPGGVHIRISVESIGQEHLQQGYNPIGDATSDAKRAVSTNWRLAVTIRQSGPDLFLAGRSLQPQSRETAER